MEKAVLLKKESSSDLKRGNLGIIYLTRFVICCVLRRKGSPYTGDPSQGLRDERWLDGASTSRCRPENPISTFHFAGHFGLWLIVHPGNWTILLASKISILELISYLDREKPIIGSCWLHVYYEYKQIWSVSFPLTNAAANRTCWKLRIRINIFLSTWGSPYVVWYIISIAVCIYTVHFMDKKSLLNKSIQPPVFFIFH